MVVSITDAFLQPGVVEVEAGEVACVGVVLEAGIDAIGTVVDGSLERRQAAGRADEFDS